MTSAVVYVTCVQDQHDVSTTRHSVAASNAAYSWRKSRR